MASNSKRLPDAELEIMLIIWKSNCAMSASSILQQLKTQRKWALATLMTVLSRLCEKGFLVCEKQGRNNFYKAVIGQEEYKQGEGKCMLEKLFDNSLPDLIASLYHGNAISQQDMQELQAFLERAQKGEIQ